MADVGVPGVATVPLRVLRTEVISGTSAATLATAMNNFWAARDQEKLIAIFQVAAFEVVVVYTSY